MEERDLFTNKDASNCNDNRIWLLEKQYPKYTDAQLLNERIFVSIASYRDAECSQTISSLYQNAKYPQRIYVGVCEQNKDIRESCNNLFYDKISSEINPYTLYSSQISEHNMNYKEAKGPTYARYFCSTLWKGQQYYLQIDSHMKFEPNWDEDLINMYAECKKLSDKPFITSYPPSDEQMTVDGFPVLDRADVGTNGLPIFFAAFVTDTSVKTYRNHKPLMAAGLFFTEAKFLYDVPFDPYLSGLFQGEETLIAARLYTNGYDSYAPVKKVVTHHYARDGPLYHKDMTDFGKCRDMAEKRAKLILGITKGVKDLPEEFLRKIENYSIGTKRSINDFWRELNLRTVNSNLIKI